jgi:hypothetical protein
VNGIRVANPGGHGMLTACGTCRVGGPLHRRSVDRYGRKASKKHTSGSLVSRRWLPGTAACVTVPGSASGVPLPGGARSRALSGVLAYDARFSTCHAALYSGDWPAQGQGAGRRNEEETAKYNGQGLADQKTARRAARRASPRGRTRSTSRRSSATPRSRRRSTAMGI